MYNYDTQYMYIHVYIHVYMYKVRVCKHVQCGYGTELTCSSSWYACEHFLTPTHTVDVQYTHVHMQTALNHTEQGGGLRGQALTNQH